MTCDEFQVAALDLDAPGPKGPLQQAAREHLRECVNCAAFYSNWQELRSELGALGAEAMDLQTPSRVEMRLRQEFRTKHKTLKARRNAVFSAWALAAAAVLVGAIGWINWNHAKIDSLTERRTTPGQMVSSVTAHLNAVSPAGPELGEALVASNNPDDFTLLPGSMPGLIGDGTVVHVQMQRSALGALGFTVNEEHAGDWIQVDLLVGDDGQPQAVRLPESED